MAAYQEKLAELAAIGLTVYAASVDRIEYARQVAESGITFPIAYGVTRDVAESIGAWWENRLGFVEPAEFVIGRGGVVLGSMYASGAVGRVDVDDVIDLILKRERRNRK